MAIDWTFIGEQEGAGVCKGYVPLANTSESGVTIATGVDLGQRSAASLATLGLSPALQAKLAPYCGMKKQAAQAFLDANPLTITTDECTQIDNAIRATHLAGDLQWRSSGATEALRPDSR